MAHSLSLYDMTITPVINGLKNLSHVLSKGEEHAKANNIPLSDLLEARLAPDMHPLPKQIIIACNTAKFLGPRISNHPDKSFTDDQQTFEEMQTRIAATIEYLQEFNRDEFDTPFNSFERKISLYNLTFTGGMQYATMYALPNFYFHTVTAYDILRHKGVPVGKMDFIAGGLDLSSIRNPPPAESAAAPASS